MGRGLRQRPARLAGKLRQVRSALGVSQDGIIRRLGLVDDIQRDYISAYERGVREPPLPVLLEYARVAGVCVDILINDKLNLPARLPGVPRHKTTERNR